MATDAHFRSQLRRERRRRREAMNKQNKRANEYQVDTQYTQYDRERVNQTALEYCDALNDNIDQSLDNALAISAQTAKRGANTCAMLDEQRHQIKRIHKELHQTDEHLKDSDRSIQTMQSWKKGIVNWFRGSREKNDYNGMDTDTQIPVSGDPVKPKHNKSNDNATDEKWNKKATSNLKKTEQKQKLIQLDHYVDNLLDMAQDMGHEMKTQNKMIAEVQDNIEDLESKFSQKNRALRQIVKNK